MPKPLREMIVPYRQHSLKECDEIIVSACNINRTDARDQRKLTQQDIWWEWIEAILNEAKKPLNDYEQDFMIAAVDRLTNKGNLTKKMAAKLEEIYTEKV